MTTSFEDLPEGTVTVLFTDTVGSTELMQRLGDERANALRQEIVALCREQLAEHRGVEVKGTGDGLMLAFQSARRGVRCAQAIQRAVEARNDQNADSEVSLRIGLHTGEVIHDEEDLFGETVVIASRLEQAAEPGSILTSANVRGLLGTVRDELVDRGEIALKGIAEPWQVYEVPWAPEEAGGTSNTPAAMVGRDAERDRLAALLDASTAGRGSLVMIAGEPGIGKTRLTQELTARARQRGGLVLVGHCYDQRDTVPFQPLLEMLETASRVVPAENLRAALGDDAPEVAKIMPQLRRIFDDIPDPLAVPEGDERRYLLDHVRRFLERAARVQPMVLVFEDLHWADESSLLLIQHLALSVGEAPLLLVGTYRDVELDVDRPLADVLQTLLRERLLERVSLRRLDREGARALIAGLASQEPPAAVVDRIFHETEGNPFFLEEVFRHLRDSGRLFDGQGRFSDDVEIQADEVPEGVQLVIGRRLTGVDGETRRALSFAAVIGRQFGFDQLEPLVDRDENTILDAMDEATHAQLISVVGAPRDARFQFSHELVRQTLLGSLSVPRRQRLHLRIADGLEKHHGSSADDHAAELAHHLYEAGMAAEPERTLHYLEAAEQAARRVHAWDEAHRSWQKTLELLEDGDDRLRYARHLVRAFDHASTGALSYRAALPLQQQALEIFEGGREPVGEAAAATALGVLRSGGWMPDLMDQARAAAFLAQARRILEPQGDSAELQNVLENEAVGDHAAGRWDSGVEQAASAVAMGGRLGRPVNVALLMGMANELSFAPAPDLDASFRRVWEISRIANDVWGGQLVVAGSGFATYICYDPRTLASIAHSELGLDRQSETIKPVIRLMAALGDWEAGTPPDAATLDALSIQRQWSSQVDLFLPQFLWRLGRWAEAAERAAATTAAYRAGGAHGFVATFTAWTAAISATAGDFRAAGAIAELVAGTEAHLSDPAVAGWARVDSAIRLARVGESRPAQDELQRAGTMVGDLHRWRGRAGSFHLAEGLIALAQLGPEAAEPAISRAIDVFRQHSGLWWEADAWFLWGEALANEGHAAGARAKLDASLDVYGRLNASGPWLDRVHRELSKL